MRNNFLTSSEGMMRRFPNQIVIGNYTLNDLYEILMIQLNARFPKKFGQTESNLIFSLLNILNEKSILNNQGGDISNLVNSISLKVNGGKTPWEVDT